MGKHHDKIAKALEIRIANMPKGSGFKKPGSMNKKKTGYHGVKANNAKQTSKEKAPIAKCCWGFFCILCL